MSVNAQWWTNSMGKLRLKLDQNIIFTASDAQDYREKSTSRMYFMGLIVELPWLQTTPSRSYQGHQEQPMFCQLGSRRPLDVHMIKSALCNWDDTVVVMCRPLEIGWTATRPVLLDEVQDAVVWFKCRSSRRGSVPNS